MKYRHINYKRHSITLSNYNGKTKVVIVKNTDEFIANLDLTLDEAEKWARDKIDEGVLN